VTLAVVVFPPFFHNERAHFAIAPWNREKTHFRNHPASRQLIQAVAARY